jgi:magnesium-transporting ATPase (P-type)
MLSSDAEVIRNGKVVHVPANEVVPGDLVNVNLGDRVPADIRMLDVTNLATSEAALTGESLPIEKITTPIDAIEAGNIPLGDRKNMAFSATLISQGRGVGLVVATGDHTQIGTINTLVNMVETKKTYYEEEIGYLSTRIAIFVICCPIVTFCFFYFTTSLNLQESISATLVGSVAMIPAGIASIVSSTYARAQYV